MIARKSGIRSARAGSSFASRPSASPMISNFRSTAALTSSLCAYASESRPATKPVIASAAFWISHRYARASGRIDEFARALDRRKNIGVATRARLDQVDGAPEQALQALREAE